MQQNNLVLSAVLTLSSLLVFYAPSVTAAGHKTATGEAKVLSGTVEIDQTQLAFIVSGKLGGGVLKFQGKEHEFKIGGLGVGAVGVQKLSAKGKVYNLTDLSKFPGTYVQADASATLGEGKGAMSLSNQNGVIMELESTSQGIALSAGADGVVVTMK